MTKVTREQARQAYKDYRYGVSRWIGEAQALKFFEWDKACQVALKYEKWGALVVALKELTIETNDSFAETEAYQRVITPFLLDGEHLAIERITLNPTLTLGE